MQTTFTDNKIGIRPYAMSDIDPLFEAAIESTQHIHPFMPWCHPNYTRKESVEWVESREAAWQEGSEFTFVIYEIDSNEFLGSVSLNEFGRERHYANLGYWIRASRKGQSITTRAAKLAIQFRFTELKLSRIEIRSAVDNKASQRVAEKLGAQYEGMLRNRLWLHEKAVDELMYFILPND